MAIRIKLRQDIEANWTSNNPLLASGEIGFETDTRRKKTGDGVTYWNDLVYDPDLGALGPYFILKAGDSGIGTLLMSNSGQIDAAAGGSFALFLGINNAKVVYLGTAGVNTDVFIGNGAGSLIQLGGSVIIDHDLDSNSHTIKNLPTPSLSHHAANKAYVDAIIASNDAMVYKGVIDCSTNPNYPAADAGHTYRVSVAGKIGGASGINVENGDLIMCNTDSTAAGNQAAVGTKWGISQTNLDGAVIGPSSAVDSKVVLFDGTSGKLIKDSGLSLSGTNTGDETATTIGVLIGGAGDATPNNSDFVATSLTAGGILKKITWTNVKAFLKTYFDTIYQPLAAALTSWASVTRASGFDAFVETPSSANLATLITDEGTAFNKSFGTGTSNVPEIGATLGNSQAVQTNASGKLITSDAPAEADISTTIVWTGTTPPSSLAAAKYAGYQCGKFFKGWIRMEYDVAGTALTNVSVVIPASWPTPMSMTEWDNSEIGLAIGGYVATIASGIPVASRAWIEKTGGGIIRLSIQATSGNYSFAIFEVDYITA